MCGGSRIRRMHRFGAPVLAGIGLGLLFLQGCSQKENEPIYGMIQGSVTFEGQPVRDAVILFQDPEQSVYLQSTTDQDGKFNFSSMPGGGLPVGNYQIAVQRAAARMAPGQPIPPLAPFPPVDAKYGNPDTSSLQVEVQPGENRFEADLKRKI